MAQDPTYRSEEILEADKSRLPVSIHATKTGEIALSLEGGDVLIFFMSKPEKKVLQGHDNTVWTFASMPGRLITGSMDCTIAVWDIEEAWVNASCYIQPRH
jgi:WD40 repeat protein